MRIGIDARMLGTGFGLARYVQQLVLHLEATGSSHEFVLFLRKENWDMVSGRGGVEEAHPGTIITQANIQKVLADIPWYGWQEQTAFLRILNDAQLDLMHFPHWNAPLGYRRPFVLTIHDLTMFHYPRAEATTLGPVVFWLKDQAHRFLLRQLVRRARHIITASEFTRQDVHDTLGVPLENMTTVYQAPFSSNKTNATRHEPSAREKAAIKKPYVLYVGAAYPHKNLPGLLKAWQQVEKTDTAHTLVLAGKRNAFYDRLIASDLYRACARVQYIGLVSDEALLSLYREASLFVYPSLYEGFGLPPLEALASGVASVVSNRSSLPEILGEAAIYVDPENAVQMAEMILRALRDRMLRADVLAHAKETLGVFSPTKMAQQTGVIWATALQTTPRD